LKPKGDTYRQIKSNSDFAQQNDVNDVIGCGKNSTE
jgi:hypothetical protein